jgi:hypothetical protein
MPKCIWNTAHTNALVIVTAHVSPGEGQQTDVEIVDSSPEKRVYLSKKNIKGETRLAITTHAEGEVGVCFRNHLGHGEIGIAPHLQAYSRYTGTDVPSEIAKNANRTIDLDVDIGADAVDYKYVLVSTPLQYLIVLVPIRSAIANQESLSGLEVEMRKLEGIVKEIVEEMEYLKNREERFSTTNRMHSMHLHVIKSDFLRF